MSLTTAPLPETFDELRSFAHSLQSELYAKTLHIEKLKMQLAVLRRAQFGRSSEKLDQEIEQMELLLGELEEGQAERIAPPTIPLSFAVPLQREKTHPVRHALPEHLPRERVEHEAACACPACGGSNLTLIGTDEREVLEYVPSHFKVMVHARPKLACRDCETITQAPLPWLPIERGVPGPSLLAHVLAAKYCDHLPLHRQSVIYAREGVDLDRSTLADWVGHMAALLAPLAEAISVHVREGSTLHADDTPVPVLDPGRGKTKTGRLWVAVRDERPWGSGVPPAVFYLYSADRKAEQAEALLKGCEGYLHADGYAGFNNLYEMHGITGKSQMVEVACWAHVRRKIFEVKEATGSPAAHDLLERMAALFKIEADIRGRSADERQVARTEHALPLLGELKVAMETALTRGSKKTALSQAIRYALTRWPALMRYTEDGRLDMTNNAAERAIRPIAIGRKNWIFAGSDDGGRRAAIIYTLTETAKFNNIDPEAYLRAVISRIAQHPMRRIHELLPWNIIL